MISKKKVAQIETFYRIKAQCRTEFPEHWVVILETATKLSESHPIIKFDTAYSWVTLYVRLVEDGDKMPTKAVFDAIYMRSKTPELEMLDQTFPPPDKE